MHLPYKDKQQDRKYWLIFYDIMILKLLYYVDMRIVPDILFNEFYTINIHPVTAKYKNMTDDKIHHLILKIMINL